MEMGSAAGVVRMWKDCGVDGNTWWCGWCAEVGEGRADGRRGGGGGGNGGADREPETVAVRAGGVQQDVQEPADHEDAPQDALHGRQRRGQGRRGHAAHAGVRPLQGPPQQEDPLALPQVPQDLRRPLRAPPPLRPQALRGREALRLPQVREKILHRGPPSLHPPSFPSLCSFTSLSILIFCKF